MILTNKAHHNGDFISQLTPEQIKKLKFSQFSDTEIEEVIRNNKIIDFYFGHKDLIDNDMRESLEALTPSELELAVEKAKSKSILELALNITPYCNANCSICYTDSIPYKDVPLPGLLSFEQSKIIIDQAVDLGAKSLFIAGVGEPTLDRKIFDVLRYADGRDMKSYVFTNGIMLSNDDVSRMYWGVDSLSLLSMFKETGCYLGPKLWSLIPSKFDKLTGTKGKYNYVDKSGFWVPKLFEYLDKTSFPSKRVIVNTAVTTDNADEVCAIIRFCLKNGYKILLEEFVRTGRARQRNDLKISAEAVHAIQEIASNDCVKPKIQVVVSWDGYLQICKGLPKFNCGDYSLLKENGSLLNKRHALSQIVNAKYSCSGRCWCESINIGELNG